MLKIKRHKLQVLHFRKIKFASIKEVQTCVKWYSRNSLSLTEAWLVVLRLRLEVSWSRLRLAVGLRSSISRAGSSGSPRLGSHLSLDGLGLLVLADAAVVLRPLLAVVRLGGRLAGGRGPGGHLLLYELSLLVHPQRAVVLRPLGRVVRLAGHCGPPGRTAGREPGLVLAVAGLVAASSASPVAAVVAP